VFWCQEGILISGLREAVATPEPRGKDHELSGPMMIPVSVLAVAVGDAHGVFDAP
jgi:hypothetical protein